MPRGDGTGYQQTSISKTVFWMLSSDYNVLRSAVIAMNNFIQLLPSCSGVASPKIWGGQNV